MYLETKRYVLGNTDAGIRPAVRSALQLYRENRVVIERTRECTYE